MPDSREARFQLMMQARHAVTLAAMLAVSGCGGAGGIPASASFSRARAPAEPASYHQPPAAAASGGTVFTPRIAAQPLY